MLIVDDQILFRLLANQAEPLLLQLSNGGVATTSSWYFRLARAIISARTNGSLSGLFSGIDTDTQTIVQQSLRRLPNEIGCPEPKTVISGDGRNLDSDQRKLHKPRSARFSRPVRC